MTKPTQAEWSRFSTHLVEVWPTLEKFDEQGYTSKRSGRAFFSDFLQHLYFNAPLRHYSKIRPLPNSKQAKALTPTAPQAFIFQLNRRWQPPYDKPQPLLILWAKYLSKLDDDQIEVWWHAFRRVKFGSKPEHRLAYIVRDDNRRYKRHHPGQPIASLSSARWFPWVEEVLLIELNKRNMLAKLLKRLRVDQ